MTEEQKMHLRLDIMQKVGKAVREERKTFPKMVGTTNEEVYRICAEMKAAYPEVSAEEFWTLLVSLSAVYSATMLDHIEQDGKTADFIVKLLRKAANLEDPSKT